MMTTRARLGSFALTGILLAGLVGWASHTKWKEMQQLSHSFEMVESDAFHLSDHIEASIRDLHETVLRFDSRGNHLDRVRFLNKAQELKEWIQAHKVHLITAAEGARMTEIETALEDYLSGSMVLMDEKLQSRSVPTSALTLSENNLSRILGLCEQLAAAEQAALGQLLEVSRQSLARLQRLLLVLLLLLLGLAGVLALSFYRELLAPLRSQLRQSRTIIERQEKLASLGTLAAGLAHEIRNPLTAINVRAHSLKRNLVRGSSEHEDATVIDSEIRRLESIVQEFLQFARPAEPKFVTVSADSLLTKVHKLLARQLDKSSIELSLESPPDVWIRVDPHQVEQALINLIQNAAESIEHDGKISLRARTDNARLTGRTQPVAVLEVSDTGRGIPLEVQKRLFDPFFTTKEQGTGLGLSIATRIIEQQGGALHFKTELNRGTVFSIVLPRTEHHSDEFTT